MIWANLSLKWKDKASLALIIVKEKSLKLSNLKLRRKVLVLVIFRNIHGTNGWCVWPQLIYSCVIKNCCFWHPAQLARTLLFRVAGCHSHLFIWVDVWMLCAWNFFTRDSGPQCDYHSQIYLSVSRGLQSIKKSFSSFQWDFFLLTLNSAFVWEVFIIKSYYML